MNSCEEQTKKLPEVICTDKEWMKRMEKLDIDEECVEDVKKLITKLITKIRKTNKVLEEHIKKMKKLYIDKKREECEVKKWD